MGRYTYAMGFQTLLVAASELFDFWGMSTTMKALVLFIACPLVLCSINYLPVYVRSKSLRF